MSKVIRITESVFRRLQKMAVPFQDTPASVIETLLDFYESRESGGTQKAHIANAQQLVSQTGRLERPDGMEGILSRLPRQRGVVVEVDGQRISAASVFDLYGQVLRFLAHNQHLEKLRPHLPLATSSKRYLVATEPFHPNGNEFVRPVEYRGYIMESHKDYKNGMNHLRKMLGLCGLSLSYIA